MKMFELIKDQTKNIKKVVFVTGAGISTRVEYQYLEEKTDCGEIMTR
jgi:NAD-dependent SIR2 family protein deacetylase